MFGIIFFRNALNFDIGGDRTEQVIWRVNNLSFPASIKVYNYPLWCQQHQIQ